MTTATTDDRPTLDELPAHTALGVGCRLTLAAMTDRFADVILGALDDADATDLDVRTDDVSTYATGPEAAIARWVRDVIAGAAARAPGTHLSATLLLSRGCPGELRCELPAGAPLPAAADVALEATGVPVAAHWSLYPLGADAHLAVIEGAVERARRDATFVRSEHYTTRLEGDLAAVLATVVGAWAEVGASVQHVTSHLTVSVASPSAGAPTAAAASATDERSAS